LTAASSAFDVDLRRQTQGAAEEVGRGVVDTREGVITDQHDVECRGFKRTNTCLTAVSDGYIETLAVKTGFNGPANHWVVTDHENTRHLEASPTSKRSEL
jgi:hypothetical protein